MSGEIIDLGAGCSFSNLTFATTGGSALGAAWRLHAAFPAGATVHTTWTNTTCNNDVSPTHFFVQLLDDTGAVLHREFPGCGTGPKSYQVVLPRATLFLEWGIGSSLGGANSAIAQNGVSATVAPCGQACPYGTRVKAGLPHSIVLTTDVLGTILSVVEAPWLLPIFFPLLFSTVIIEELCAELPPPLPVIDLSTAQATANTALQIFKSVAWFTYCECTPGSPAPTPPPLPRPVEPPGWPTQPVFTCDPADICSSLVSIRNQLAQLQQALAQNVALTTLIQRYSLPFGLIPGLIHGPLSGQGQIAVSRLIGLRVFITTRPPNQPIIADVPPYVWNGGWISVTNAQGMLHERRVNRDSFDWLPDQMPLAETIGYSLTPGTQVLVQELLPEP